MENESQEHLNDNAQADVAGFIAKTYQILNNDQYIKIIHWGPTGKEFVIRDITKFQEIVLPKYFRHKKMNSFVRQLNMYGFHKSRKDNSKCIFSHPNFLKDREDLLASIKRKIRNTEHPLKTPTKQTLVIPDAKILEETSTKQASKSQKKVSQESTPILTGFLDSRPYLNSFINLNVSLKKISVNNFDVLDQKQDDDLSIAQNMDNGERDGKQKLPIVNPSFFFCSFNELN